jgi:hypothetical protein
MGGNFKGKTALNLRVDITMMMIIIIIIKWILNEQRVKMWPGFSWLMTSCENGGRHSGSIQH